MNAWILLIGIILFIIGLFLSIIGGIEKFKLNREDDFWLVLFILGLITIAFSIGFIVFSYMIDKKKFLSPQMDSSKYWTINLRWPTNFINQQIPKVIVEKPIIQQQIGTFVEKVVSPPLI
jgi:hypothetical protein